MKIHQFEVPVLAGAPSLDYLRENLGALDVELSPADISELDAEFAMLTVHGVGSVSVRYNATKGFERTRQPHRP